MYMQTETTNRRPFYPQNSYKDFTGGCELVLVHELVHERCINNWPLSIMDQLLKTRSFHYKTHHDDTYYGKQQKSKCQ